MHPCLQVIELVHLIFDYIEPDEDKCDYTSGHDKESLGTLASLARTCKLFTEPSVDRLWRDQLTLTPLVQCMPQDLWAVISLKRGRGPDQQCVRLRRPIQRTDWDRFEFYASKIHRLGIPRCWIPRGWTMNPQHMSISKEMLLDLSSARRHRFLLPNLRALGIDHYNETRMFAEPCAQGILGPTITDIRICAEAPRRFPDFELFCSALSVFAPNIQRLSYAVDEPGNDAEDAFSLLSNLPGIQSFTLEFPRLVLLPESVFLLASFAKLTSLRGVNIYPRDLSLFTTGNDQFSNLKELGFCADCSTCSALLGSMHCKFEALEIYVRGPIEPQGLERLTAVLTEHRSRLILKRIYFLCGLYATEDLSLGKLSFSQLLKPLFLCTALESVELHGPCDTGFDDQWLDEAARAWKSLRHLSLDGKDASPRITLAGLIPLIKYCPRLQFLALELQPVPVNPALLKDVRNFSVVTSNLRFFIPTTASTAQIIHSMTSMFPNLRHRLGNHG